MIAIETMTEGVDPSLGEGNVFGKRPNVLSHLLSQNRPLIMGVLNITPDSFSDGGQFIDPNDALRQAQKMIEAGADIIDIGGESTRPYGGSKPVSLEEELGRLQPVLPAVIQMGIPVSPDKPHLHTRWASPSNARRRSRCCTCRIARRGPFAMFVQSKSHLNASRSARHRTFE